MMEYVTRTICYLDSVWTHAGRGREEAEWSAIVKKSGAKAE